MGSASAVARTGAHWRGVLRYGFSSAPPSPFHRSVTNSGQSGAAARVQNPDGRVSNICQRVRRHRTHRTRALRLWFAWISAADGNSVTVKLIHASGQYLRDIPPQKLQVTLRRKLRKHEASVRPVSAPGHRRRAVPGGYHRSARRGTPPTSGRLSRRP